MQLLPEEDVLVTSNQDKVILTNQRVQLSDKEWGRSHQITIFLEDISSIENVYKSNPIFLVLSGLGAVIGLLTFGRAADGNISLIAFILTIAFLLLWVNSRQHAIIVSSNGGGRLTFLVGGMGTD